MSSRKRVSNIIRIDADELEQVIVSEIKKIEKDTERALKEKEREMKKQAKAALKEKERGMMKQAKAALKEKERAMKKQAKAALKEKELVMKKQAKAALKEKDKQRRQAIKQAEKKTKDEVKIRTEKARKKEQVKFEVNNKSISIMIKTAKRTAEFFGNKFKCINLCEVYIHMNGLMNPYTLEEVDDKYDLEAAIRGLMYESSPSSAQHWFRYGAPKEREQIAPCIFYNKSLATVNNEHGWKVSDSELKQKQREKEGYWSYMEEGSNAFYDWDEEKYGPLPTNDVLNAATVGRKVGTRGKKV
jgi:hypothetical protein